MIGLTFSLFFAMIFMLSVMVMDALIEFKRIRDGVEKAFSKDNSIFPDHVHPD